MAIDWKETVDPLWLDEYHNSAKAPEYLIDKATSSFWIVVTSYSFADTVSVHIIVDPIVKTKVPKIIVNEMA